MIRQRATAMASIANRGRLFGPTLNYQFPTMAEVLPPQIQFARASAAWRYNSAGVLEIVPVDAPRFDYVGDSATEMNLFTESEFRNGLTDLPTRGNVSMTTMEGYAAAVLIPAAVGTTGFAYKTCNLLKWGQTATFTAEVEAQDDLGPPTLGANTNADLGIIIAGVDATTFSVAALGGRRYRVRGVRTIQANGGLPNNNGLVKRAGGTSTRVFKATAYQIGVGNTDHKYWPTTTSPRGNATPRGLLVEEQRTNAVWPSMTTIGTQGQYYNTTAANSYVPGQQAYKYVATGAGSPPMAGAGYTYTDAAVRTVFAIVEVATETPTGVRPRLMFYRTSGTAAALLGVELDVGTGVLTKISGGGTGAQFQGVKKLADVGPNGGTLWMFWATYTNPDLETVAVYPYPVQNTANLAVIVHHFQLETGWFPTSVITTVLSAQTRAAENPIVPRGAWYNQNGSTLVVKLGPGTIFPNVTSSTPPFYSTILLGATGINDGVVGFAGGGAVAGDWQTVSRYYTSLYPGAAGGSNVSNLVSALPTIAGAKMALSTGPAGQNWKGSGLNAGFNALPELGPARSRVTHLRMQPQINGWIEYLKYYPRVLSAQELATEGT